MSLLLIRMLQEFSGHALRVDSGGHVVMALVSQHTHYLSRQGFIQQLVNCLTVGSVPLGNRTVLDVLARPLAQSFDVSEKWFISHDSLSCIEFSVGLDITRFSEGGASRGQKTKRNAAPPLEN